MVNIKTILAGLLALFISQYGFSQTNSLHIGLSGNVAIPSAELKKAVDNPIGGTGAGFNINMVANPFGKKRESPVFVGVDFSYLTFGRDKIDGTNTAPPYKSTFNYYAVNGLLRLVPLKKDQGLTPFVDGMIGAKFFNTTTKIDKNAFDILLNDDQPEVINSTTDAGLGYSLGVGFFNKKSSGADGETSSTHLGSLSLRVLYLWGDNTTYVKRGSVEVSNGTVTLEQGRTRTDMVMIQLGLYLY